MLQCSHKSSGRHTGTNLICHVATLSHQYLPVWTYIHRISSTKKSTAHSPPKLGKMTVTAGPTGQMISEGGPPACWGALCGATPRSPRRHPQGLFGRPPRVPSYRPLPLPLLPVARWPAQQRKHCFKCVVKQEPRPFDSLLCSSDCS